VLTLDKSLGSAINCACEGKEARFRVLQIMMSKLEEFKRGGWSGWPLGAFIGFVVVVALLVVFVHRVGIQPILSGAAQFTMLLSAVAIIAAWCMFIFNFERQRDKLKHTGKDLSRIIRITRMLKYAVFILFVDVFLCLVRIWFALFHLTDCLPPMDAMIVGLFSVAIGLSLMLFLESQPWWWCPRQGQGKREKRRNERKRVD